MGILYSHIVFQPPNPPTYTDDAGIMTFRKAHHDPPSANEESGRAVSTNQSSNPHEPHYLTHPIMYLTTSRGNTIPAAYFHHPQSYYTILFSHGNGEDLGITSAYAFELCAVLKTSILCYDYSGYGLSSGKPSEANVYADIDAAYTYLVSERRISPTRILLFGRSLGSGPTVELATKLGRNLAGVVLIAALTSCVRVVLNSPTTLRFDMFANIDKIGSVQVPVFCVHGMQDDVVPFSHSVELSSRAKFPLEPYWVRDAGHNNLETGRFQRDVFLRYITVLDEFKFWAAPLGIGSTRLPSTDGSKKRENIGALAKAAGCFGSRTTPDSVRTPTRAHRRRNKPSASASGGNLQIIAYANGKKGADNESLWCEDHDRVLPRPASLTEMRSSVRKSRLMGIIRRGTQIDDESELASIVR